MDPEWSGVLSAWRSSMAIHASNPKIRECGNTPLCRRCILIFQTSSVFSLTTYLDVRDFVEAGKGGCYICTLLYAGLPATFWDSALKRRWKGLWKISYDKTFVVELGHVLRHPERIELSFRVGYVHSRPHVASFSLILEAHLQLIPETTLAAFKVANSTSSSLELARHWYHDCLSKHDCCGPFTTTLKGNTWLPTRLIYITATNARLCSSKTLPEAGFPYATLSHCWGQVNIFTMNMSNIADLEIGLPMKELPKTFQDAIFVCRALQVRYLWIDSLCIIQDSADDWAFEANLMGLVYKHCCLNIAATGFSNGMQGLFVNRDARIIEPMTVASEGNEFASEGSYHIVWDSIWQEQVSSAPLNTRAWVFQERLLSPRTLHFGSREVLWECKKRQACESYRDSIPDSAKAIHDDLSYGRNFFKASNPLDGAAIGSDDGYIGGGPSREDLVWEFWRDVVATYSRTQLTKEEDKLVALKGIIGEVERILGSECLAGIWRRHLQLQLLWHIPRNEYANTSRPQIPQAPSWSWASLNAGTVPWPTNPDMKKHAGDPLSKLLFAWIEENKANCPLQGELCFQGPLMEVDKLDLRPSEIFLRTWEYLQRKSIRFGWGVFGQQEVAIRLGNRDTHEEAVVFMPIILRPDYVREWHRTWSPFFENNDGDRIWRPLREDNDGDVPETPTKLQWQRQLGNSPWPKLMKDGIDERPTVFLLPLCTTLVDDQQSDKDSSYEKPKGDEKEVNAGLTNEPRQENDRMKRGFTGLILTPVEDSKGVFRRLGTFTTSMDMNDLYAQMEGRSASLLVASENYQSHKLPNEYVVAIV